MSQGTVADVAAKQRRQAPAVLQDERLQGRFGFGGGRHVGGNKAENLCGLGCLVAAKKKMAASHTLTHTASQRHTLRLRIQNRPPFLPNKIEIPQFLLIYDSSLCFFCFLFFKNKLIYILTLTQYSLGSIRYIYNFLPF